MSMLKYVTVGEGKRRKADPGDGGAGGETDRAEDGASAGGPGAAAGETGHGKRFQFVETKGDLFYCSESESLAHCISADVAMGKGIAVIFKKKFGGVRELKNQDQKPGGLSTLKRGNRYIYYLITKEKYWHKPTYETLESSLSALCKHCADNGVRAVSMPRIGCGLDGLTWPRVSEIIKKVFTDSDVKITVYTL